MTRALLAVLAMLAIAATASAAATVAGSWTMKVEGGPHGDAAMGLTLKQDGDKVTGTFATGHSADMAVAGEFVKGQLKLETTAGQADDKIIFTAKLKDDGTLAGSVSSPMGDMKWTASRVETKDKK